MSKRKNIFFKWIKIIVVVYVLLGVGLYLFQDKFFLHPVALPADYKFQFAIPFEEINVRYNNTTSFHIIRFKSTSDSIKRGAVIYFHGNMENITHYAMFADNFTKLGYDVWMMDYPTFGKSTGTLNEEMLYTEAMQVYKMVVDSGYAPRNIIIYGKSLGTGIAAQLSSVKKCKRLILESPYYSVENLASRYAWMYPVQWMIHYKIPAYQYLQKVKAPVTIFHGTNDETIPFSNSEKLQPFLKTGDELIAVEGGGHNNLNDFPLMKQKLDSLLQTSP
jgi:alpha-beta hydrolase superfamily lysophospholipase